jgi:ATP synthase protein I
LTLQTPINYFQAIENNPESLLMPLTPEELGQKIKDAQGKDNKPSSPATGGGFSGERSKAMKAASDFISAIVVGVFLGYWIDRWFNTTPFGIIIFLLLGFGAGVMNLYRAQMGSGNNKNDKNKK